MTDTKFCDKCDPIFQEFKERFMENLKIELDNYERKK